MERLIRFFVERHLLVHVMVGVVVVLGYASALRAPRETFPNVTLPTLFVDATLPGASARDVETKLAIPLEEAIRDLDGVDTYRTVISDNVAITTIELYDDYGPEEVRQAEKDLRTLIDGITDFPPEMEDDPVINEFNPRKFPVIQIALAGPTDGIVAAARELEQRLERLDTISQASSIGLRDPEVRILVDPVRARELGVTLLDVVDAVQRRNVSATGGMLETDADRRQVVLWSRFEQPSDVGAAMLRFLPDGGAIRVRDVARVELTREDTGLLTHTNGAPGITVVATKRATADIVDTVDDVRAVVEATTLPEGVTATLVRDESFMTRNRLQIMTTNGAIGAVLVSVVLFLFLTPRTAIWVLVGIPVVFLGTLIAFQILGLSINMITLTGFVIVLGLVVDDAVVISEGIVTKRQQGMEAHEAATLGASELARPVVTAAITTMLAFLPMFALGGMAGKIMVYMPVVVILALAISLFEALFILPAHMSSGSSKTPAPKRAFVVRLEERYRALLDAALDHRRGLILGFVAALVVVFGGVLPRMGVQLFPQDDSQALFIKLETPLGTPLEQTEAIALEIERQLPPILGDDLAAVTARIGHQEAGGRGARERERGAAENQAVVTALFVNLGREHTSAEWIEVLERELVVPFGTEAVFEAEFFGPPIGMPVTVHVASNSDEARRATAQEVAARLAAIGGVSNVEIDERPGTPQIDLNLDHEKLALRGLSAEDVASTLRAAFHGLKASEHRALDETTDYRVLFDPSARRSLDALLETPVRSRSGALVRLRDVVNPLEMPAVSRIYHRNGVRTATVVAGFTPESDHTAVSMAAWMEKELLPDFAGVPGLDVSIGGEAVETRETTGELGAVAAGAVLAIGLAIALMLGSVLEALFVIAVIPFSVASVLLAFFLHGEPLSLFAMLGSIGLSGVVVNASIVMVDAVHRRVALLANGDAEVRRAAVLDAVVGRLRPIMVTTLTTLGGVLPTAYGIGGYDAIVSPMSLALGWGLFFATGVTLFLVPALYTLANDLRGSRLVGFRPRAALEALRARGRSPAAVGPDAGAVTRRG